MSNNADAQQGHHHALDADAVCAACGTVNPEGTLLCKTCGNNLRDQRQARLSAETAEEVVGDQPRHPFLSRLVVALALLVLIAVIVNLETVVTALANVSVPTVDSGPGLYSGALGAELDGMALTVERSMPPRQSLQQVVDTATLRPELPGTYALYRNAGLSVQAVGTALVAEREEGLAFVARLYNGIEVRGLAQPQGATGWLADWDSTVAERDGELFSVAGVAQRTSEGRINGQGVRGDEDGNYAFFALPITLPAPGAS